MSRSCLLCHCDIEVDEPEVDESEVVGNPVCDDCRINDIYENSRLFGRFLFLLRKRYKWSRKFMSKKLGFNSETSVMNFETGKTLIRTKHVSLLCKATPNNLTVPIIYAMYEAGSLEPPCKCICHYDRGNKLPEIYDDDGRCQLCNHADGDCKITNGLWFEKNEANFFDHFGEPEIGK